MSGFMNEERFVEHIRLAELELLKDNYNKSKTILDRLESEIRKSLGDSALVWCKYLDIRGDYYFSLHDVEAGMEYWRQAEQIRKHHFGDESIYRATDYYHKARYFNFRGSKGLKEQEKALTWSKKAIGLYKSKQDSLLEVNCGVMLREYAFAYKVFYTKSHPSGVHGSALARIYFNQSLEIIREQFGVGSYYEANVLHDLGNTYTDLCYTDIYAKKQTLDTALNYYDASILIRNKISKTRTQKEAITNFVKGLAHKYAYNEKQGELEIGYYNKALDILLEGKNLIGKSQIVNYSQVLELLLFKAWTLEKISIRDNNPELLLEAINQVVLSEQVWKELLRNYQSEEIYKIVGVYLSIPYDLGVELYVKLWKETEDKKYLHAALEYAEKGRKTLAERNRLKAGMKAQDKYSFHSDLDNVMQFCIDNKTSVIEYFAWQQAYIFIIEETGIELIELGSSTPLNSNYTDNWLRNMYEFDLDSVRVFGNSIYKEIVSPFLEKIDNRNLIIVPYGGFSNIPFEALQDNNGKFLIENFNISYASSLSVIGLRDDARSNIHSVSPTFDDNSALPFSQDFSTYLKDKFNATDASSISSYKLTDLMKEEEDIIHIASHCSVDRLEPLNSIIHLQNDSISVRGIYNSKVNSNLIVLNACETGLGDFERSEGVISHSWACIHAGAKSVINTLWKVDDQSSNEIFTSFYEKLSDGNNSAQALTDAKREYLANTKNPELRNPIYWAGFVHQGLHQTFELEKKYYEYWELLTAILITVLILAFGWVFLKNT